MMELIFLGTGGAQPTLERSTTCICLVKDGEILMFDAGEGAQISYLKSNLGWNKKMKIFGIGTDIVNIKRKEKSIKRYDKKFKKRIFSDNEIIYCEKKKDPAAFYAKRFAAKEALSKALGTGIRKGIDFKNIEISNDRFGKPSIKLMGTTANFLKKKLGAKNILFIYLYLTMHLGPKQLL